MTAPWRAIAHERSSATDGLVVMASGFSAEFILGPAGGRTRGRSPGMTMEKRLGLLQQPCFLVELLGAGMERDAEPGGRSLRRDQLALGVTGVELPAGLVAPERLGDLVDEVLRLLCRRDPLGVDRDGLRLGDILVDAGRHRVPGEELVVGQQLLDLRSGDRNEADAGGGRKLGDRPGRIAADEEESVERVVLQTVAGRPG